MIEVRRITEYSELDQILPLIQGLHKMHSMPLSISAKIAQIALQLQSPYQGIWVGYEEGRPVGYAIATIETSSFELQCLLVDVYTEKIDDKELAMSHIAHVFDLITLWAKENGCKRIVTFTYNDPKVAEKKWGWKPITTYMMKEI
jgi:hypothetical protein